MGDLPNDGDGLLVCEQSVAGSQVSLLYGNGTSKAIIEPLSLQTGLKSIEGHWNDLRSGSDGSAVQAQGHITHASGTIHFTLAVRRMDAGAPFSLRWHVQFEQGACTGAIIHRVTLPGVLPDRTALDLPSIYYGSNTYGKGLFPHPDPATGFAFRADRLAQPAIHYTTPEGTWSYFAADEAPVTPVPELLYSLIVEPVSAGLTFSFQYPQREYGHTSAYGSLAYVAKDTFKPGEASECIWEEGAVLEKTLYVGCHTSDATNAQGETVRFLWRLAYPEKKARGAPSLWWNAGQHIRWFNRSLYNPRIGGGQYESPSGSNTAMLGFVEQSLCMASTTLSYACLSQKTSGPALQAEELSRLKSQAADALTCWSTEGRTSEGILYPACDEHGYCFGYRNYSDYENLTIVKDGAFDTIRLASEARALLSASASTLFANDPTARDAQVWAAAATGFAQWMRAHALPTGGYSSRYSSGGEPLDNYPGGTAAVISLFCDCASALSQTDSREGQTYVQDAVRAYESALAALVRAGAFSGGTLDASCPDREAAIAALDACLLLYDATGDEQYLADGRIAADNILSYTMVYPIRTFGPDTDAARRSISTFGASIVSPENQHLDPVPTGPGLIVYGLYADDEVCVQAGIESLKWSLDGRWAIEEQAGLKQSEQLLHTRWYYNAFFSQRGDFRRGMPLWGLQDSEHGWPQVVPSAAMLGAGQVIIDWLSGRAAGVDGWRVSSSEKQQDGKVVLTMAPDGDRDRNGSGLFLRVLRLSPTNIITLDAGDKRVSVSAAHLGHGYMLDSPGDNSITLTIAPEYPTWVHQ